MAPIVAGLAVGGIGSAISGISNYLAQRKAAKEQGRALDRAGRDITGAYNQGKAYQQPYYDQGTQDYTTLGNMVRGGDFNVNDQFNYQADPGAAFRMEQGLAAINTNAAARGSGLSGSTLAALQKYGSGLASQEYQAAFDRFTNQRNFNQQEQNQRYGRMSDMAGYGERAATRLGDMATNYGSNMANLNIQRGNVNSQAAQIPGIGQWVGQQMQSVAPYAMAYGMGGGQMPSWMGGRQPQYNGMMKPAGY